MDFKIRQATLSDIPFLVDTIIEAEKSGTNILSYEQIFGLTESDTRKYLQQMFEEEVDGCELSISSFLIAEHNETIAAAVGAWEEGKEGISSSILKGNLLQYCLPKDCIAKAKGLMPILNTLAIEYIAGSIQIGVVYVNSNFRGQNLVTKLLDEHIKIINEKNVNITDAYVQVFANNQPAIKAYSKAGFNIEHIEKSEEQAILNLLPFNEKILMHKKIS